MYMSFDSPSGSNAQYVVGDGGGVCVLGRTQRYEENPYEFSFDVSSSVTSYLMSKDYMEIKQRDIISSFVSSLVDGAVDVEPEVSAAVAEHFWDLI